MKTSMLKPVRIEAGLGNPPQEYTNNDPESANFLIKHGLQFNAQKPHEFIDKIKEMVETQQRNEERAVFGMGPYRLRKEFQHLGVSDQQRTQLTAVQTKKKVASYLSAGMNEMKDALSCDLVIVDEETRISSNFERVVRNANIINVPPPILDGMIRKANNLLSSPQNVVPTPGASDGSYIVAGSSNKFHLVKPGKGGSWTCDATCVNRSTKICEHILAATQENGSLQQFLTWFGRSRKRPNFLGMVEQGGPKNAGKKPSSRKRSNAKSKPVEEYADIFERETYEANSYVSHSNFTGSVHMDPEHLLLPSMVFPSCPRQAYPSTSTLASTSAIRPASFSVSTAPCGTSVTSPPFASSNVPSSTITSSVSGPRLTLFSPTLGESNNAEPSTDCYPRSILSTPFSSPSISCTPTFSVDNSLPRQCLFRPQPQGFSHSVTSPNQSPTQPCAGSIFRTTQHGVASSAFSTANALERFNLKWVPGTRVSKCYGCGNKIENPPQALPDDLIIVYRAVREYRDRITGQLQTSTSAQNVHFHLRAACVSKRYPDFHPGLLDVQPHFIRLLRPEHFQRLFSEFGWVYNP